MYNNNLAFTMIQPCHGMYIHEDYAVAMYCYSVLISNID